MSNTLIMDGKAMDRALARIAHEVIEKNKGTNDLAFMGIQRRGVPLAHKIAQRVFEVEGTRAPVGILDITLYRDDLSVLAEHPIIKGSDVPFSIDGLKIVMVDDVLYTGRTARAAMDAIMDMGRPKSIQLAVLIDRGHRELPIRADYVGKNVPTSKEEIVHVKVPEFDGEKCVEIGKLSDNQL
ncbi:MAG: bifunctional pyr operon transcriptional regulator/uracil phosphoribosyltransferase PyrR [Christensenellales bacterium]|jgi:pyrimidine operon attenuation protein/uracil phosphoribosyltransferase